MEKSIKEAIKKAGKRYCYSEQFENNFIINLYGLEREPKEMHQIKNCRLVEVRETIYNRLELEYHFRKKGWEDGTYFLKRQEIIRTNI